MCFVPSIRSNPDKRIRVESSMRETRSRTATSRTERYDETAHRSLSATRSARPERYLLPLLAFERDLCCTIEHRIFFSSRPV